MNTEELRRSLAAPPADRLTLPPVTDLVRAGRRRRTLRRAGVAGSAVTVAAAVLAVPALLPRAVDGGTGQAAAPSVSPPAPRTSASTPAPVTDPAACTPHRPAGSTPLPGSGEAGWPTAELPAVAIGTTPDGARMCGWLTPASDAVPVNVVVAPDAPGRPTPVAAGALDTTRPAWWWTNQPSARGGKDWYVIGLVPASAQKVVLAVVGGTSVVVAPVRLHGADVAAFYVSPQDLGITWSPRSAADSSPVKTLTWTDAAGSHVVTADQGSTVG